MIQPNVKSELEHWRGVHDRVEKLWGWSSPAGKRRAERRARYFVTQGEIGRGKKVLEVGCGTGVFAKLVAAEGSELFACDLVPEFVEKARALPGVRVELQDIHRMTFSDSCFDVVYGSSVLHHLDLDAALREIHRVLKPGGRMVFAEPNMLNPQILIQKNVPWIKRWMGDTPGETAFFRWSLKRRLRMRGFEEIEIVPHDFLHPLIPERWISTAERWGALAERTPIVREIAGSLLITGQKPVSAT